QNAELGNAFKGRWSLNQARPWGSCYPRNDLINNARTICTCFLTTFWFWCVNFDIIISFCIGSGLPLNLYCQKENY
ncbi:hypothetical protein, partial [Shewanella litorisediminis]